MKFEYTGTFFRIALEVFWPASVTRRDMPFHRRKVQAVRRDLLQSVTLKLKTERDNA
jgi:hypothetical protein